MILDGKQKKNLTLAVELINGGDVVGFPTETVYGLGGDAFSLKALKKIYEIKGRPLTNPLILHVASHEQLDLIAAEVSPDALKLIEKFWPGPLTLVFKKKAIVPDLATAGLATVAVRMPRHLVALALIKNSGRVIAAPSANSFQSLSPTSAQDVEKELGEKVPLILDGGPCLVGVESTVVSVVGTPTLLRPGGVTTEDLELTLGYKIQVQVKNKENLPQVSPGMLDFHYAPKTPLKFFKPGELEKYGALKKNAKQISQGILICFSSDERKKFGKLGFKKTLVLSSCGNSEEAARHLFSTLRLADEGDYLFIFALECPSDRLGAALNDRLRKAEHGF